MSHRLSALAATALVATLATACGGGDPASAPPPIHSGDDSSASAGTSPSPSESASASPSPSASSTASGIALSPFEDEPTVATLRLWAGAFGHDINTGRTMSRTKKITVGSLKRNLVPKVASEDFGTLYIGPLPFTPIQVRETGRKARVDVCAWLSGWARDPQTQRPTADRQIVPAYFMLRKQAAGWRVSEFKTAAFSCSKVRVRGVPY